MPSDDAEAMVRLIEQNRVQEVLLREQALRISAIEARSAVLERELIGTRERLRSVLATLGEKR